MPKAVLHCRRDPLAVNSSLRSKLASQTRASLRRSGVATSDQREVWREVERFSTTRGVRSRTSALSKALDELEGRELDLQVADSQVGFAAWLGGRLIGLELFGSAGLLRGAQRRLLLSALAEARHGEEADAPAREVGVATADVLELLGGLAWQEHEGVGEGRELRAVSGKHEVVALVAEAGPMTLSVLAA